MKKTLKLVVFLTLSLLISNSCKKKEEEEEQPHEIAVNEQTKVMPVESRQYITSIEPNTYTFTFNGSDNFINDLTVGNILVDSMSTLAPYGYLRKITAITEDKGNKQIQTELVTLTEAVPKGVIDFHTGNLKRSQVKSMILADGVKLIDNKDGKFDVFNFTYNKVMTDPSNSSRKITLSGETALSLDFFFNFDGDGIGLPALPLMIPLTVSVLK